MRAIFGALLIFISTVASAQTEAQLEQLEYSSDVMYESSSDLYSLKGQMTGAFASIEAFREIAVEALSSVDPEDIGYIEDFIAHLDDVYDDGQDALSALSLHDADLEDALSGYQDAVDLWFDFDYSGSISSLLDITEEYNGSGGNGILESFIGLSSSLAYDFIDDVEELVDDAGSSQPQIVPVFLMQTAGDFSWTELTTEIGSKFAQYQATRNSYAIKLNTAVTLETDYLGLVEQCKDLGASEAELAPFRVDFSQAARSINRRMVELQRLAEQSWSRHQSAMTSKQVFGQENIRTIRHLLDLRVLAQDMYLELNSALDEMTTVVATASTAIQGLENLRSSKQANQDPMMPPVPGEFGPNWIRAHDAINQLSFEVSDEMLLDFDD